MLRSDFAFFNLGFRPFFLGAAIYSVIVMLVWMAIYVFKLSIPMENLSSNQWHAHEMVYGYALAVIAGFLLTAIKNWTGIQTVNGPVLLLIFSLWLVARLLFLFGSKFINIAGIFDILFMSCLSIAAVYPVIKSKNWRQLGILSKLILLVVFNVCFYLGALGILEQGIYWGIYGGLYLVVSLILTIGSRVIPFFIERGVTESVQLSNPKWITILGLLVFLVFFISELFMHNQNITGIAATALFVIYSIRLIGWYTNGIWEKPLLWSLFLAMLFINIGFILFALSIFFGLSQFLAIHAFAYGGIGVITLAMMVRVSLGHTGRNINEPPASVKYMLGLIVSGAVVRVFFPIISFNYYVIWITFSQLLWISAFILFITTYAPILVRPRVDGQFG